MLSLLSANHVFTLHWNFSRCRGLVLLETYSAVYDQDTLLASLPKFLVIEKEVTGDPAYSMYNLSLKEDWKTSKKYYTGGESKAGANGKAENVCIAISSVV